MPTSWTPSVKKTGQLSVFAGPGVSGGWATVLKDALAKFNALSKQSSFGVTFITGAKAPDFDGNGGGADVQFDTGSNQVSFSVFGQSFSKTIDPNAKKGRTFPVNDANGDLVKAFIFVPVSPKAEMGTGRVVGNPVKLVMAVHELVHACGLSDDDHSKNAKPDVFYGTPNLDLGRRPQDDRIILPDGRSMPPLWISSETGRLISSVW